MVDDSTKAVTKALSILRRWSNSGEAVVHHILSCPFCLDSQQKYCADCNRLWAVEMENESEVIGILPVLVEAGIDVEGLIGGFKFKGREA